MGSQYMQNKGMTIPFTQNMNLSNYKANSHIPLTAPGLDLYGIQPLTILLTVTNTLNGLLPYPSSHKLSKFSLDYVGLIHFPPQV